MDFIYRAPRATIRRTPHCTTLDNNAAISHDRLNLQGFNAAKPLTVGFAIKVLKRGCITIAVPLSP